MCPLLLLWRLSTMYDKQPASQDNNSTFQCTTNSGSSETVPECADRTGGCRQIQRSDRNWLATRNRKRRNRCQLLRTLPTFYSILESSYQVLFDNYFDTKGISCTLKLLFYFLVKFFFVKYNRYNKKLFCCIKKYLIVKEYLLFLYTIQSSIFYVKIILENSYASTQLK